MSGPPDDVKTREQLLEELQALREHDRAETRRSEAIFRGLVEAAPDAMVIVDRAGRIVLINSQTERLFGYGRDELLGRPVEVLVPEALRAQHVKHRQEFLANARVRPMGEGKELAGRRKSGEEFAVEISLSPLETAEGLLIISTIRDVSERKRAEVRLRKAEARYRSLVEEIPAVTFMAALDGDVNELYVSPQIESLLGFSQKEWLEDPVLWARQLHPGDRDRWNNEFAPTVADGLPFSSVYRFVARSGRVVWVRGEAKVIKDDDGRPIFLQGIAFDITALKEAEEELRTLNQTLEERVRQRTAEAERRAEELARSNKEMEIFGRAMAHDLREPLRSMSSYTKMLAKHTQGRLDEQARGFIDQSIQGADRMREKIDKLLEYARVGTETKSFAWVEGADVFAAACASLHAAVEESGARVTAGPLPRAWGQKVLLELLLQNLIGNALKFRVAGRPPVIRVEAREQKEEWLVTVTDNGIGMKSEHLQRIFGIGMESRLNLVREYPGHGIGLATCEKIVQRHGGCIWAESPGPGLGATLAFTLPIRPATS
jgi:PAS domain S-box-containing protein